MAGAKAQVDIAERFNLTEAEVLHVGRLVDGGAKPLDAVRAVRGMRDGLASARSFRPLSDTAADELDVPRYDPAEGDQPAVSAAAYDVLDGDEPEPEDVDVDEEPPTDLEVEEGLQAWAEEAVADGVYPTVDAALDALVELDLAIQEEQP